MQIYWFSFDLLTGIMDLGTAYLSLQETPQTFTEWSFSLNIALPLSYAVSLTPLHILISPRNGSTEALVSASLKSPHSPKVQKEQFRAEQHTKAVLTRMPSPLPSTQTSLPLASYWLVAQVPHQHQLGVQLAHHHYHLKEGFRFYRGQVPIYHCLSGLCCFQHHHTAVTTAITLFIITKIKVSRIGFWGENSWSSSPQQHRCHPMGS